MIKSLSITHFSDIPLYHPQPLCKDLAYPKRTLGYLNLLTHRKKKFPKHASLSILDDILKQEADLVVFSGDMTTASHPLEFKECARLFAPIYEKWGERFFVIPGNHDRYSPQSIQNQWYETYFPYGKMENHMRSLDLHLPDQDPMRVIGFDASRAFRFRSNGHLSPELAAQIKDSLQQAKEDQIPVILVGHYPAFYPSEVPQNWNHILINLPDLHQLINEFTPLVYLHGHKHQRWVIQNTINSGSCGMLSDQQSQQAGYVTIQFKQGKRSVFAHTLQKDGSILKTSL